MTSTEAAGIGALGAMGLAVLKGMRWRGIAQVIMDAGKTAAPVMILLVCAGMYSRFLALGGIIDVIRDALTSLGLGGLGIIVMMVVIWLLLGMLLDSVSIILLTVPIFAPMATGIDPFAFAIFGILAIEAGLLTPPFGLIVFVVKGTVPDPDITLSDIFSGSIPYWLLMLVTMVLVYVFPGLASWLTRFV